MKINRSLLLVVAFLFNACATSGQTGDSCISNDDCAEGLECHIEEHDEHDEEEHDEHEEEHDEHEEQGVCEEEGAHDHEE